MTEMDAATGQLAGLWSGLKGEPGMTEGVRFTGSGSVPARFPVTALAAASTAAVGVAVAELCEAAGLPRPEVVVDRARSLTWFGRVNRPIGWTPAEGNGLTGMYRTADDRWIRMQMNYRRHRTAVLGALGCEADRDSVEAALAKLTAQGAEDLLVAAGGAVAMVRTPEEWAAHPQGQAVAGEPLIDEFHDTGSRETAWTPLVDRPLAGIRVLDMTRVLAGPMSTRMLASFGAEVLRIDPPGYFEERGATLVSLGKRCARVDAATAEGRAVLLELLASCDVMVHGYRHGVLERLGLGQEERRNARPGLIEATLTAYGWTGPWSDRRSFDTVVEAATGMAHANQEWGGGDEPLLLPVQALDYGTGQLLAASVIRGLTHRLVTGEGSRWRAALARTAAHLVAAAPDPDDAPLSEVAWGPLPVSTPSGPAYRVRPPLDISSAPQFWDRPGEPLGASVPMWAREVLPAA